MALDRLSSLPDDILSLVLSNLTIRDAIKCSVLSRRWRFLYREIPHLTISPYRVSSPNQAPTTYDLSTVENRIFDVLRFHSSDLKSFTLTTDIHSMWGPRLSMWIPEIFIVNAWQFTQQSVSEWMRWVAQKNVEHLSLEYCYLQETPPSSLFLCSRLTNLTLDNCILTTFPTDFAGFNHLTECSFTVCEMTDDILARFLLHCPLLRKLNLSRCSGLNRPVILSHSLTDLVVSVFWDGGLTVNCPKLQTLKAVTYGEDLTVNGMGFYELSSKIHRFEMERGNNLIELWLSSVGDAGYKLSVNRFLEFMGTLRSLKVLTIHLGCAFHGRQMMAVPLLNLLSRLPNLQRLHLLGQLTAEYVTQEDVEGDPIAPASTYPLVNLQLIQMDIIKYDARVLRLLGCLLQIAPGLKQVKPQPPEEFFQMWESLKKSREQGTISEEIPLREIFVRL
eukprot:PITA_07369